jgi:hypothetical protein
MARSSANWSLAIFIWFKLKKMQVQKTTKVRLFQGLLSLGILLVSIGVTWGQGLSKLTTRFANPQFDEKAGIYSLDVEMRSDRTNEQVFGMNVRFFYDETQLSFLGFDQFQDGYKLLGEAPRSFVGNSESGAAMFGFEAAAAYINGAVQLQQPKTSFSMSPDRWSKFFRVTFKVKEGFQGLKNFCPCVIWDIKANATQQGFFEGSNGVVVTVVEKNAQTPQESAPSLVSGEAFNWDQSSWGNMPYGNPLTKSCLDLKKVSTNIATVAPKHFLSMQNSPNPFVETTYIEFVLPEETKAKINFYDLTGKLLFQVKDTYVAGYNQLKVDRQSLSESAGVVLYQLVTDDYSSAMLRMVMVNK